MTTVNATVTSKNQLTLPIKLVRKYKLDKNRVVTITDRDGVIEIRLQPTLEQRMKKHWDAFHRSHPNFPALSDEDIHGEVRKAYESYYEQKPGI